MHPSPVLLRRGHAPGGPSRILKRASERKPTPLCTKTTETPVSQSSNCSGLNPRAGTEALRAIAWDGSVDDGLCSEAAGKLAEPCW